MGGKRTQGNSVINDYRHIFQENDTPELHSSPVGITTKFFIKYFSLCKCPHVISKQLNEELKTKTGLQENEETMLAAVCKQITWLFSAKTVNMTDSVQLPTTPSDGLLLVSIFYYHWDCIRENRPAKYTSSHPCLLYSLYNYLVSDCCDSYIYYSFGQLASDCNEKALKIRMNHLRFSGYTKRFA